MKIAIVGAGGVGGYYGGVLARAGHEVRILARGEHLEAMRAGGLEVRTPEEAFTARPFATGEPEALGVVDVALVAVKAYSLGEIAPAAARLAAAGAAIVPLLNGVDAAARLEAGGVPRERLLGGVTYISAAKVGPGVVERYSAFTRVRVGAPGGGESVVAERLAAALREASVDAVASVDIAVELWRKFVRLSSLSAACGLARAAVGPVRDAPYGRELLERLVGEAAAVGRARGVALPAGEEAEALEFLDGLPPAMKPSFLLDLEAGGPNELDVLSGAVARLGREASVATPVHDAATAALAAASAIRRDQNTFFVFSSRTKGR